MSPVKRALSLLAQDLPDPDADVSLPGWTYSDAEFHALEQERIFRPSWQIVCHISELAQPGAYRTIDFCGESVIVIRGEDGAVRAFTNVCRHRAMRLVEGPAGCARKLVCPYHAWTYETDGRLTGVPMRGDYPALRLEDSGLTPVAIELWHGFVFVRLKDAGYPTVAEMMAPFEDEVAPYRFAEMQPMGSVRLRPRAVNWKTVGDNYSDNLHIPVAHAGLTRLVGASYRSQAHGWADRLYGDIQTTGRQSFWERFYSARLPRLDHLPAEAHGRWLYYKLWPNMAFDIYADQIDFMQWLPTGPTTCLLREVAYCLPDSFTPNGKKREMKLVRYANWRINRVVNAEDTWLITRVQQGMASRSYGTGPIATSEVCLRSFAKKIRTLIPESRQPFAPAPGWSSK
ncbi:phenylpropionate dioxygenase-like ring-hydroxylating dioxygenase large terminal subunit [Novosphingobium kunmingense]|uniref:Phenylpropionate dioxygenase-like ring-hydroxylating dioxygenase large terminal subunit n=1 Tax=Novosphingobium kunmingense TaxID=1211806 RepID=A0A2N0H6Z1_9SPHN|nr:aromatic ring-hydroxylating dioxygenase subunit alpha [Novosphingobium kunmingense]PKB14708.1 phenylpropionate dioxygenase-like ring-hydroxylating dioxygenase large terminal subunit [Novosphingobium kunmingense]